MQELALFYRPTCPYCQKVLRYIEENNISVELKDVSGGAEAQQELMTLGGKTQVPCLSIDGKALYESNDIIQWLSKNG